MLTLNQASLIVDKALEKGRELGFKPLTSWSSTVAGI